MNTIENLKEMERLARTLMKTVESPETRYRLGLLLQLFGKEAERFGELNQLLSGELTELEVLRKFIESQGLSENFEAFRKIGRR
ncbi:hypothetical protein [Bacillus cereus]|uniref:hypothetical protein n=1 Tax=Bacillus cereus TaxID=1396 RepID=UPI000BF3F663|nr:hypothetical protein [Bacillus cereus]PEU03180.1 hypothetical protein CN534_05010 [Bacillus cereus]PEZ62082.1 hypothetical protein CN370_09365 [Bacillus cereus]PFB67150.1 hypothetical protein CN292_21195 [Bacillus cereus]